MKFKKTSNLQAITLFFIAFWFNSCQPPEDKLSKDIPAVSKSRNAKLLSCFFGLDNNMPDKATALWKEAPGKDGMPIIFSHEIDPLTLNIAAFKITTKNGTIYYPQFATFKPANEEYEMRTILLIGEFGNSPVNPPVKVEIVKDLKTRDGQSLKGQTLAVTPLENGPFISYAEYFYLDKDGYPYVANGRGCDCLEKKTDVVVRTVWAGGVMAMNGNELSSQELEKITIHLQVNDQIIKVHPYQLADIGDNDNNIDLCIKGKGIPVYVEVQANTAIDPAHHPNPKTESKIVSRY